MLNAEKNTVNVSINEEINNPVLQELSERNLLQTGFLTDDSPGNRRLKTVRQKRG